MKPRTPPNDVALIARKVLRNLAVSRRGLSVWVFAPDVDAGVRSICTIAQLRRLAEFADGKPVEVEAKRKVTRK